MPLLLSLLIAKSSWQLHTQPIEFFVKTNREIEQMADADLDVVIRQLAKQQHKALMVAAKSRRDRYIGLAAKAKTKDAKDRYKQIAKDTMLQGAAAAKRLQVSADNAADSYARSMRNAAEAAPARKTVENKTAKKKTAKQPNA